MFWSSWLSDERGAKVGRRESDSVPPCNLICSEKPASNQSSFNQSGGFCAVCERCMKGGGAEMKG